MPTALQPFGGKATVSPKDRFWNARLQLTFTYTAILVVILCISGGILYGAFSHFLVRRFERFPERPAVILPDGVIPPRVEDVLRDLRYSLLYVNGLLLALAAVLSYWLAGETLEPIQRTYERQQRFLSDASHELRTPLSILHAEFENALQQKTLSAAQRSQIESHLEEVERMSQLVKDLLLLSRLDESHELPVEYEEINLVNFLEDQVTRFESFGHTHGVHLSFESSLQNLLIRTKPSLLDQIMSNLLKNAILYNVPEGNVRVSLHTEGQKALISVTDTGIGMSAEDVDKVFDRFYRVDKSRSRQTGGSGLGLSITRSLVEQIHGSIQIKSELKKGTTLTCTLPLSGAS